MRIENGKITTAELGKDRCWLTACINLRMQGAGGGLQRILYNPEKQHGDARYVPEFIIGVLEALNKEDWSDLPGTYVRVAHEGPGGTIKGIGHIYKDRWFYPDEDLAEYIEE